MKSDALKLDIEITANSMTYQTVSPSEAGLILCKLGLGRPPAFVACEVGWAWQKGYLNGDPCLEEWGVSKVVVVFLHGLRESVWKVSLRIY